MCLKILIHWRDSLARIYGWYFVCPAEMAHKTKLCSQTIYLKKERGASKPTAFFPLILAYKNLNRRTFSNRATNAQAHIVSRDAPHLHQPSAQSHSPPLLQRIRPVVKDGETSPAPPPPAGHRTKTQGVGKQIAPTLRRCCHSSAASESLSTFRRSYVCLAAASRAFTPPSTHLMGHIMHFSQRVPHFIYTEPHLPFGCCVLCKKHPW